ncbi:FliA/WhiG family RNA polymerase sigma factor [Oscillospiraceae bacterium OttesenSCG-928-F05]|nr:FliA/WhiG family RNA polymerase sigma factor [Oscillospiraceae bacterium OttesenSCG-928-F05]
MPKAKETPVHELWQVFAETRDPELRRELVLRYTHLVKTIVYRMIPTYKNHVEFDDLMSCGVLGLMDAVDKFDLTKEVKFETYASLRIKGEIIDQLRKLDWVPVSLRQKLKKIEQAHRELEEKYGRFATEDEVAAHLDMRPAEVQKVMDESHTFNIMALDEVLADRSRPAAGDEFSPEQQFEDKEMKEILAGEIDKLGEKERLVISLYYYNELTLKEIGLTLGVSESRVSQIHSKAILTLKNRIKKATEG